MDKVCWVIVIRDGMRFPHLPGGTSDSDGEHERCGAISMHEWHVHACMRVYMDTDRLPGFLVVCGLTGEEARRW